MTRGPDLRSGFAPVSVPGRKQIHLPGIGRCNRRQPSLRRPFLTW
jgi:hypothetical protein